MLNNKRLIVFLISAFMVLLSFWLHTRAELHSMINHRAAETLVDNYFISETYLTEIVDYHQSHPSFVRRPLTTGLIKNLTANTSFSIAQSFTLINFFLLFCCGPLLFFLARSLGQKDTAAIWSVLLFYTGFSILFAFFPSIYSYDDPLQYCLVMVALLFLFREKYIAFSMVLTLAIICRETTLLLLPGLALFYLPYKVRQKNASSISGYAAKFIFLLLPVLAYGAFLFWFYSYGSGVFDTPVAASRWHLFYYNFQNSQFAIESFFSLLLGWGLPTFLLFFALKKYPFSPKEKTLIAAFLLCLLLNTLLVLLATKARETRLFALPLLLLWPLSGGLLLHLGQSIRAFSIRSIQPLAAFLFLLGFLLILMIVLHLYRPTGLDSSLTLHKPYLFAFLSAIYTFSFFQWTAKSISRQ